MPLVVEQVRGGLVETLHPIVAALVDADGVRWELGGDFPCFWRSASKPLQLLTSLEQLPADQVTNLTDVDLAIGAASHGASGLHLRAIIDMLGRFGLSAAGLKCGAHWPSDEASHHALVRAGEPSSALHNNCSGKHTFMLAAATERGWDPDYRPIDHPLQRLNQARMMEWCEAPAPAAVDGCGVPTFHAPLRAMARAFSRLAREMTAGTLAGRIGLAMHREPFYTSHAGEIDVALVQAAQEPLTAKRGAEGLVCVAFPNRGWGLAVKCLTGNSAALATGLEAILHEIAPGLLGQPLPGAEVRNVVGAVVGARRAVWT